MARGSKYKKAILKRKDKREKKKLAGLAFTLKKKIPMELVRTKLVYSATAASIANVVKILFNADGVWTNAAGTATFTDYDSLGVVSKFALYAAIYDLYMVTFVKIDIIPLVFPTVSANAGVSGFYTAHLSAA